MPYIKRSKNTIKKDYITRHLYAFYKTRTDKPVSLKIFTEFLIGSDSDFSTSKGIIPQIMLKIINENFEWHMPFRFGFLSIKKYKPRKVDSKGKIKKRVDYKASFEYWRKKYPGLSDQEIATIPCKPKIYHDNDITNEYQFKFYWNKYACNIKCNSAYKFYIQRYFKRYLSKKVRDPYFKTDYYTNTK